MDSNLSKGPLIARGRTAELYAYGDGRVLKLFYDWCSPEWIDREIMANAELASGHLRIPHLFETVEMGGRRGLIFERVQGQTMLKKLSSKPWQFAYLARQFASLHAETHQIKTNRLPDVREGLRHTIQRVEGLPSDQKEAILKKLRDLPDGDSLCHYDFHPDQVLMTVNGPVVIDWMTAFRGSPAADVARTSIILQFSQAPYIKGFQAAILSSGQKLFYSIYLNHYLKLNPSVRLSDVRAWMVPVAAGRLREDIAVERNRLLDFISRELGKQKD